MDLFMVGESLRNSARRIVFYAVSFQHAVVAEALPEQSVALK
jgi:hypothetical protein